MNTADALERDDMLRSLKALEPYTLSATDGELGHIENFLLDDETWKLRYLVVATGGLLGGRRVLISPLAFREVDWLSQRFHVAQTLDKIRSGPSVETDRPVSRQDEHDYHVHYGWQQESGQHSEPVDIHLRSLAELLGYKIQGTDAAIGHVADFIVDDQTWTIRYLVVNVGHWWHGKDVLVSPLWASQVDWAERTLRMDLTREAIKKSPEWNPTTPVNRQYEARLYDYYGRPVYWAAAELQ
jgi:sporulation protein YlmC with PRC-barrel domain